MDPKTKRRSAEQVRKLVLRPWANPDFRRGRSTFWIREHEHTIDFMHLHLFRASPAFRVHFGIRVLNDPFPAPALNGPHSDAYSNLYLDFSDNLNHVNRCAGEIGAFCVTVGEPWFHKWSQPSDLLSAESPLDHQAKEALRQALAGASDPECVQASRRLLGAA